MFSNNFNILFYVIVIISISYVKTTEFVPVYMWGTIKASDRVPALHKTSEDSFKDTILEYLKKKPYIVIFAEHTLSPEDFAQRDPSGSILFTHISNLKKSSHIDYRPSVQNPIGAVRQLDKKITELSINKFIKNHDVPEDNILIIDLNDAKDDEPRSDMLKRHDSDIVSIYNEISKKHTNILAIYTAHHSSWVAPEDITHKRTRNLLANDDSGDQSKPIIFKENHVIFYLSRNGSLLLNTTNVIIDEKFTATSTNNNDSVSLTLSKDSTKLLFEFLFDVDGYWNLNNITVTNDNKETILKTSKLYAPNSFSYHCSGFKVSSEDGDITLELPGLQVQPYLDNRTKFGDAYDCVGFTSIPIWSGLFVTLVLLLILTFGLTMIMDINTMDRFDDPKGKTININVAE